MLYVLALVGVVVAVDVLFLRTLFWPRLIVNVGIVVVFVAFYFRFLKSLKTGRETYRGSGPQVSKSKLYSLAALQSQSACGGGNSRRVPERLNFEQISRQHQQLSVQFLHSELAAQYQESRRTLYRADTYRRGMTFNEFIKDYPALLSTCHSLRDSIAHGYLPDYLIIDESSQVNLLLAGLAMSCARRVVVVGDQRQLPPIPIDAANGLMPPVAAYDCQHNLPASLSELYGANLPRTLLWSTTGAVRSSSGSVTKNSTGANSFRIPAAAPSGQ